MTMTRTIVSIILMTFAAIIHASAQTGLSISFAEGSPQRTEREYDTQLYAALVVSDIALIQKLVVEVDGKENGKPEILHELTVSYSNNVYYLNGDQVIYNGRLRYYTSFYKQQVSNGNNTLTFYAVDKSGNRSNTISYQLNP